jgi:hypothetical protein
MDYSLAGPVETWRDQRHAIPMGYLTHNAARCICSFSRLSFCSSMRRARPFSHDETFCSWSFINWMGHEMSYETRRRTAEFLAYLANRCSEIWILCSNLDYTAKPLFPLCNGGGVDRRGRGPCLWHWGRRLALSGPVSEPRI